MEKRFDLGCAKDRWRQVGQEFQLARRSGVIPPKDESKRGV
jgi:hypothetical protein